ncbi:hypothetical protein Hanom_Chr05g00466541 [Helianthus anomalus]
MEISYSPGHLLLLKLLQREEDHPGHRFAGKERRLDTLKREVFQLCLFFFTSTTTVATGARQFRFSSGFRFGWLRGGSGRFWQWWLRGGRCGRGWKRSKDIGPCLRGEEDAQRSEDIFFNEMSSKKQNLQSLTSTRGLRGADIRGQQRLN